MATATDIHTAADGLVVSDANILGGKPVFRGTRLPVQSLFDYLPDGLSLDYFLETFPSVTREHAETVLRHGLQHLTLIPAP